MIHGTVKHISAFFALIFSLQVFAAAPIGDYVPEAGHPSLQAWLLPDQPPHPKNNAPTPARVQLGKMLFFDPRLSADGNMSCASCHNPSLGWSDGLATGRGFRGQVLSRATPTVINVAYNHLQMWDGRKASLEDQAMGPMQSIAEMRTNIPQMLRWLKSNKAYRAAFKKAYPGEKISVDTVSKAVASFERTIVSNNTPFDRWVKGDSTAISKQQVRGFKIFLDENKGNCVACHQAPNFTDDGFHNLGLASFGKDDPDMGRYKERAVSLMKGAFKTSTLRGVELTAPYFHDGSASTLTEVVEFYEKGGVVKTNLSPNVKPLKLSKRDKKDLVAFMQALTSEQEVVALPQLPQN